MRIFDWIYIYIRNINMNNSIKTINLTGRILRAYHIAHDHVRASFEAGETMNHGAALMDGSRILGRGGRNTMNRNVIKGDVFPTIHAERSAILNSPLIGLDGRDREYPQK